MVPALSLWLPILLSAVLVFIVSSVIHMVLPYHKSDFGPVPRETDAIAALAPLDIPPGDYAMPWAGSMDAMKTPEYQEKLRRGPNAFLTVLPKGPMSMGNSLAQWFAYALVVGLFVAYVTGRAFGPGARYLDVFQIASTTAFLGYGMALAQGSIWYRRRWSSTFKSMFDALIYGLLTAGVFGWLWPG